MMKKHSRFLYWLISACAIAFAAILAQRFGLWVVMDHKDPTKISWLICTITVATSLYIGFLATKTATAPEVVMNRLWFISDAMVTLGMIGTVAGFLHMLGGSFTDLNANDPAAIQKTIHTVGAGMGTILVTTLMGLVGSVILKMQLVLVEK